MRSSMAIEIASVLLTELASASRLEQEMFDICIKLTFFNILLGRNINLSLCRIKLTPSSTIFLHWIDHGIDNGDLKCLLRQAGTSEGFDKAIYVYPAWVRYQELFLNQTLVLYQPPPPPSFPSHVVSDKGDGFVEMRIA
ncbi:hypothetical protein CBL_09811 [Carabus blaptoides fortunei]